MKTLAVVNQKGGCGKTSLTLLIALALARKTARVLIVDCDPQGGISSMLQSHHIEDDEPGLADVLGGFKKLHEVISTHERDGLHIDLLPADYRLDQTAPILDYFTLKKRLSGLTVGNPYDYVLLDTPPTMAGITRAAAQLSDVVYVPSDISATSLGPTLYTLRSLEEIGKHGKVVFVGYRDPDGRKGYQADLTRSFLQRVNSHFAGYIARNASTARAISDRAYKWTPKRTEAVLNPILSIIEKM